MPRLQGPRSAEAVSGCARGDAGGDVGLLRLMGPSLLICVLTI